MIEVTTQIEEEKRGLIGVLKGFLNLNKGDLIENNKDIYEIYGKCYEVNKKRLILFVRYEKTLCN